MKDLPLRITDRRRDLVTMSLAGWLMIGLFVDGWAHNNLVGLESFWTPWHGLFYSGFTAVAAWMTWIVAAFRAAGRPIPSGYGAGIVGLGVFAVGGVGDAIWHTLFGIETDIDALFSPTHLLLFIGLATIMTTPLRSFPRSNETPSLMEFLPVALGLALTSSLIQFVFMYASGLNNGRMGYEWEPGIPDGPMINGVLSMLLTTAIVFGPTLWASARWRMPVGTYTIILVTLGILMQGIEEFAHPQTIGIALLGGVAIDVLNHRIRPWTHRSRQAALAFTAPLALWSIYTATFALIWGVGWPLEVWSGAILWTGFAGWALSLLLGESVSEPANLPAPI